MPRRGGLPQPLRQGHGMTGHGGSDTGAQVRARANTAGGGFFAQETLLCEEIHNDLMTAPEIRVP